MTFVFCHENTYVIEGLSTIGDTMTVYNCHIFYLRQKITVIVHHSSCSGRKMLILMMKKHLLLLIIIFENLHQLWSEQVLQEVLIYHSKTRCSFFDQGLVDNRSLQTILSCVWCWHAENYIFPTIRSWDFLLTFCIEDMMMYWSSSKISMEFKNKGRISPNYGMNSFELFLKNKNKILELVLVKYRL